MYTLTEEMLDVELERTKICSSGINMKHRIATKRFLLEGIHPGSFLLSIFANDLKGTLRFNNEGLSIDAIDAIATFMYFVAPVTSYGSYVNVHNWMVGFEKL